MDMNVIDSIFYHTTLKLLSNHIFGVKTLNICLLGLMFYVLVNSNGHVHLTTLFPE